MVNFDYIEVPDLNGFSCAIEQVTSSAGATLVLPFSKYEFHSHL